MGEMTLEEPATGEVPEESGGAHVGGPTAPLAGIQRELLGAHFLLLARLLRRSARADYAGFEPHNLIERRLVLTLFRIEEGRVSELAGILGNDVAQISRALANLRAARLAERERQRDPYVLTPAGAQLGALLDAMALQREEELGRGLQAHEMFELAGLLSNLLTRATAILAEEIAHSRDDERPEAAAVLGVPEIHSRLQPAILNLGTIIARTSTLTFKRLAGLSQYEWRLLANIASRPGIAFMEVVGHVDSDKAQVSRALDGMVSNGLLDRSGGKGRQAVRFALTEEGHRRHAIMRDDAVRRNALIVEDLKPGQRRRLQAYVDRLIENAVAMGDHRAA
jgi:DNA-binding MarR family transcriptional regulator